MSESSSATRTRFTRRREGRELEGRCARSCRACNGTYPGIYAPAVPGLFLGCWLRGEVRRPPAAGSALATAAAVLVRQGALLLPVDHLLDVALIDLGKLALYGVEHGLVLFLGRLGEGLSGVPLVFAVGVAHVVECVRKALHRVGVLLRRGGRRRRTLLGDLGELVKATIGESRQQLHASDLVERQRDLHVLARALHHVERIAGKARRGCACGTGQHEHEDGGSSEGRAKDRREREPARSRRKDYSGFGHEPPAELFAELLPHDGPLEDRRASFVHARASRDGISARSASSARNWIPRTVPS